jgi:F0F1-type ATP synthase assembly protein I
VARLFFASLITFGILVGMVIGCVLAAFTAAIVLTVIINLVIWLVSPGSRTSRCAGSIASSSSTMPP